MSDWEVFESNHDDAVLADTINGLCKVVSLKEYEENEDYRAKGTCFFTRAKIDAKKQTMSPPFEEWPRFCLCQRPANPDIPVILCDVCNEWLHLECVGLSMESANQIESYKCPKCLSQPKNQRESEGRKCDITKGRNETKGSRELLGKREGGSEEAKQSKKDTVIFLKFQDFERAEDSKMEKKKKKKKEMREKKENQRNSNEGPSGSVSSMETESRSISDCSH